MRLRFLSCAVAVVISAALGGCQTGKPIAMSVGVTPTAKAGAEFGDVLAPQRQAGQDIPPLKGQKVLTVRTYEYLQKNDEQFATRTEIEGIDCGVESEGYRASLKTPAEVRVPYYGYASRVIAVRCQAPGYKPSFANVQPFDKTIAEQQKQANALGIAGYITLAIVDSTVDRKVRDYDYPPASLTMNKLTCETDKVGCR